MSWNKKKLETIIQFKNGKKRPNSSGTIPVYGGNGILGYTNESNYKDCIIVGRVGAYCGSVYYEPFECWISDNAIAGQPKNDTDISYAYYLLSSLQLNRRHIGTGQPLLTQSILNGIECLIPDIETQKKISGFLGTIDQKIYLNEEVNKNLEAQAQSIFKSWFIDAPESSSWETGTFSDIIDTMIAGDWGKDSPLGNNTEMVYCIRGADIPDVKSGNKGKMPTRFILPKNYVAKHLVAGDVVVEISGGSPTQSTGRIASISQSLLDRYDKGMVCTNFCKAMKPKSGYSMFVYYYWQYLYDKNVFFLYENGTTGIKNLDISGFIETEPIILPPVELVEKFDAFCHSVFDVIFANGLQNEKLANMRDALLPKLMSGEIDASDLDL